MGARIKVVAPARNRWSSQSTGFALDIGHDRHGQFFALRGEADALAQVDFTVLQSQPVERHLLLLARTAAARQPRKDRFLCGHDEREWFVAAVPGAASTVLQAKESLKPAAVRAMQARMGLNARKANTRHNAAFRRQGEWFFVPLESSFAVDEKFILRWEPLNRGRGSKSHFVEEVYRTGGELVHVNDRYPRGLTQAQHEALLKRNPNAKAWPWRVMRRNPGVYARGAVRHSDHATIVLHDWHRVLMNTENEAPSMSHVAFLD